MNEDRNAMALNSVAHFASPQTPEKNLCGFKTSKNKTATRKSEIQATTLGARALSEIQRKT